MFSTNKLYSNEQVTKKFETDLKFDRFYHNPEDRDRSLIVGVDGKAYQYNEDTGELTEVEYSRNVPDIDMLNSKPDLYGVYEYGPNNETYRVFYYVENNNIYNRAYDSEFINGKYEYVIVYDISAAHKNL